MDTTAAAKHLGRLGGTVRSPAKRAASARNLGKARDPGPYEYRVVVGNRDVSIWNAYHCKATTEAGARRALARIKAKYGPTAAGRLEYRDRGQAEAIWRKVD